MHTSAGNTLTIVTQTSFYFETQNKAKRSSFFCLIFPHFIPISVSFSRSLYAPCLLAHACVNRQLGTRRFPSHLSLQKTNQKKPTWIYRLKYDRFGRKILLTPTQRTISWERLRLFFFFPLPVHPRWQGGRKKGGKEVEKRERNSSYTILPIGRLYDAHLQPRGSMPHVCTVYFGLHWSFKLCYAIYRRTAHAI